MRYDTAARDDVVAAAGGVKDPPFLEALMDELNPVILDAEPRVSAITDMAAWAERANSVLGRGG